MNTTKLTIGFGVALATLASTLILPILAPIIRELHLSVSQGGLMLSIGSVVMVAAAPIWGVISDRLGRKAAFVGGFIGVLIGYILYTLTVWYGLAGTFTVTATFVALTASRAFVGLFLPAVPSSAQALMADTTSPEERGAGMAIISAATGLGLILGPAISGLLVPFGLIWPLIGAIILCAAGGILAQLLLRSETPKVITSEKKVSIFSSALIPWLSAGILTWLAIATVQISAGFYFQDTLALEPTEAAKLLSIALTVVGIAMFAVQIIQIKFLNLGPRKAILTGSALWMAGLFLLLYTADVAAYYCAYTTLGLGAGFLLPGVMAGASLTVGHRSQGVAAGLVAASQGIGFIIGPIASTSLYEIDRTLPFWCLGGLMFLLFLKFALIPLRFAEQPAPAE